MIKPIQNGFVFKMPKVKQIQYRNRCVSIINDGEKISKTYVDTITGKIIRKVIEWTNQKQ